MAPAPDTQIEQVTEVVVRCLRKGFPVEIDGLGVFRPAPDGGIEFIAETRPKVFLAYVEEDLPAAERLYDALHASGLDPWLDRKRLLPGQNWPRSIERSIEISDFFVACFSHRGTGKRGFFQAELRYALDCASRLPMGEIYLIPVRLDDCPLPPPVARHIQYVDLFPDFGAGAEKVIRAIRKGDRSRGRRAA